MSGVTLDLESPQELPEDDPEIILNSPSRLHAQSFDISGLACETIYRHEEVVNGKRLGFFIGDGTAFRIDVSGPTLACLHTQGLAMITTSFLPVPHITLK